MNKLEGKEEIETNLLSIDFTKISIIHHILLSTYEVPSYGLLDLFFN